MLPLRRDFDHRRGGELSLGTYEIVECCNPRRERVIWMDAWIRGLEEFRKDRVQPLARLKHLLHVDDENRGEVCPWSK